MRTLPLPVLLAGLLLGACAATDPSSGAGGGVGAETAPGAPASTTTPTPGAVTGPADAAPRQVDLVVEGVELTATLRDTSAARALVAQLPLTLTMRDHGGVEKTGRLPAPLPVEDEPSAADPRPADLGYYAPGHDLVLYYGDQSAFPGIVVLRRLDGDVGALARTDVDVRVTVSDSH